MTTRFACPACVDEDDVEGDPREQSLRCGACGVAIDYGKPRPVVGVEFDRDKRFVALSLNGHRFVVIKAQARDIAMQILRLVTK